MFPVGAVVGILIVIARAVAAANKNSEGGTTTTNTASVQVSRGSSSTTGDPGFAGTLLLQLMLFAAASGFTLAALDTGSLELLAAGVVSTWLLLPARAARDFLAPLGFARLAYWSAWLSRVEWRRDKPGGPAMMAAWALVHQDKPWPSSITWVENKLNGSKRALQGSGVVARGLLEAAKGNHDAARTWLESVLLFDPRVAPPQVRTVAAEWLVTDAAARGEWKRVKTFVGNTKWPASRSLTLLDAIAGRMLGEPMPTTLGLWFWWLMAPRRAWTFKMVRLAASTKPSPKVPQSALPTPESPLGAMGHATFLTVALKQQTQPSAAAVIAVAQAWEQALDGAMREQLFSRATLIGGGDPDAALSEVRELIQSALAPMLPAKLSGTGPLPALLESAAGARRNKLHDELEERMNRLESRKQQKRELPQLEEWNEFVQFHTLYRRACEASASTSDVALAHSIFRDKLVNYAVWLYNERVEKPLANAIFRFMEAEAVALGDAESERLNKKNSGCDL